MYRIERGEAPLRKHEVETMCRLYEVRQATTDVLIGLAAEAKSKGWWHSYGDAVPAWFELFVSMEAAATSLRQYEANLISGLLQIPEYADAAVRIEPHLSDAEVERRVALRLERQKILTRRAPRPPVLDVIIAEQVLRQSIKNRDAWQRQLAHLSNVARPPMLSVRVLPASVGPHAASVAGTFTLLDFDRDAKPAEPTTVYCENVTGALYLEKPAETQAYEKIWAALCEAALSVEQTQDLITQLIKETFDD